MAFTQLEQILASEYDVSAASAPVEAILWATDRIENPVTADLELKAVNEIRRRLGKVPVYVPFGHRLFNVPPLATVEQLMARAARNASLASLVQ